ncbi:hypothetical protein HHI36_001326 [Cryptolaemus montrouzieri]|uniref:RIIa domain-containing protein n=1 Tax=Cryptolaemus montrouzieri TaxID=559131 RepID=A0ABD2P7Z3_9CUCU
MELSRTIETETGEMIVKRVSVPLGLEELMEGLAKEVILKKPRDLYIFASEYFTRLLHLRDSGQYRGNIRSAKLAMKQPFKATISGNTIFSRSKSEHSSGMNIERKPTTPYYLKHSDKTATIDESRRTKIQEHLRKKRQAFNEKESKENIVSFGNIHKKTPKVVRGSYRSDRSRKKLKEYQKNEQEEISITKTEEAMKRRNSSRESSSEKQTKSSKEQVFKKSKASKSEEIVDGRRFRAKTRSMSISNSTSSARSNLSDHSISNASTLKKSIEFCGTDTLLNSITGEETKKNISFLHDDSGQFEVSYRPSPLTSNIENLASSAKYSKDSDVSLENMNEMTNGTDDNDLEKLKSALKIQAIWRAFQARKKIKAGFIIKKESLPVMQSSEDKNNEINDASKNSGTTNPPEIEKTVGMKRKHMFSDPSSLHEKDNLELNTKIDETTEANYSHENEVIIDSYSESKKIEKPNSQTESKANESNVDTNIETNNSDPGANEKFEREESEIAETNTGNSGLAKSKVAKSNEMRHLEKEEQNKIEDDNELDQCDGSRKNSEIKESKIDVDNTYESLEHLSLSSRDINADDSKYNGNELGLRENFENERYDENLDVEKYSANRNTMGSAKKKSNGKISNEKLSRSDNSEIYCSEDETEMKNNTTQEILNEKHVDKSKEPKLILSENQKSTIKKIEDGAESMEDHTNARTNHLVLTWNGRIPVKELYATENVLDENIETEKNGGPKEPEESFLQRKNSETKDIEELKDESTAAEAENLISASGGTSVEDFIKPEKRYSKDDNSEANKCEEEEEMRNDNQFVKTENSYDEKGVEEIDEDEKRLSEKHQIEKDIGNSERKDTDIIPEMGNNKTRLHKFENNTKKEIDHPVQKIGNFDGISDNIQHPEKSLSENDKSKTHKTEGDAEQEYDGTIVKENLDQTSNEIHPDNTSPKDDKSSINIIDDDAEIKNDDVAFRTENFGELLNEIHHHEKTSSADENSTHKIEDDIELKNDSTRAKTENLVETSDETQNLENTSSNLHDCKTHKIEHNPEIENDSPLQGRETLGEKLNEIHHYENTFSKNDKSKTHEIEDEGKLKDDDIITEYFTIHHQDITSSEDDESKTNEIDDGVAMENDNPAIGTGKLDQMSNEIHHQKQICSEDDKSKTRKIEDEAELENNNSIVKTENSDVTSKKTELIELGKRLSKDDKLETHKNVDDAEFKTSDVSLNKSYMENSEPKNYDEKTELAELKSDDSNKCSKNTYVMTNNISLNSEQLNTDNTDKADNVKVTNSELSVEKQSEQKLVREETQSKNDIANEKEKISNKIHLEIENFTAKNIECKEYFKNEGAKTSDLKSNEESMEKLEKALLESNNPKKKISDSGEKLQNKSTNEQTESLTESVEKIGEIERTSSEHERSVTRKDEVNQNEMLPQELNEIEKTHPEVEISAQKIDIDETELKNDSTNRKSETSVGKLSELRRTPLEVDKFDTKGNGNDVNSKNDNKNEKADENSEQLMGKELEKETANGMPEISNEIFVQKSIESKSSNTISEQGNSISAKEEDTELNDFKKNKTADYLSLSSDETSGKILAETTNVSSESDITKISKYYPESIKNIENRKTETLNIISEKTPLQKLDEHGSINSEDEKYVVTKNQHDAKNEDLERSSEETLNSKSVNGLDDLKSVFPENEDKEDGIEEINGNMSKTAEHLDEASHETSLTTLNEPILKEDDMIIQPDDIMVEKISSPTMDSEQKHENCLESVPYHRSITMELEPSVDMKGQNLIHVKSITNDEINNLKNESDSEIGPEENYSSENSKGNRNSLTSEKYMKTNEEEFKQYENSSENEIPVIGESQESTDGQAYISGSSSDDKTAKDEENLRQNVSTDIEKENEFSTNINEYKKDKSKVKSATETENDDSETPVKQKISLLYVSTKDSKVSGDYLHHENETEIVKPENHTEGIDPIQKNEIGPLESQILSDADTLENAFVEKTENETSDTKVTFMEKPTNKSSSEEPKLVSKGRNIENNEGKNSSLHADILSNVEEVPTDHIEEEKTNASEDTIKDAIDSEEHKITYHPKDVENDIECQNNNARASLRDNTIHNTSISSETSQISASQNPTLVIEEKEKTQHPDTPESTEDIPLDALEEVDSIDGNFDNTEQIDSSRVETEEKLKKFSTKNNEKTVVSSCVQKNYSDVENKQKKYSSKDIDNELTEKYENTNQKEASIHSPENSSSEETTKDNTDTSREDMLEHKNFSDDKEKNTENGPHNYENQVTMKTLEKEENEKELMNGNRIDSSQISANASTSEYSNNKGVDILNNPSDVVEGVSTEISGEKKIQKTGKIEENHLLSEEKSSRTYKEEYRRKCDSSSKNEDVVQMDGNQADSENVSPETEAELVIVSKNNEMNLLKNKTAPKKVSTESLVFTNNDENIENQLSTPEKPTILDSRIQENMSKENSTGTKTNSSSGIHGSEELLHEELKKTSSNGIFNSILIPEISSGTNRWNIKKSSNMSKSNSGPNELKKKLSPRVLQKQKSIDTKDSPPRNGTVKLSNSESSEEGNGRKPKFKKSRSQSHTTVKLETAGEPTKRSSMRRVQSQESKIPINQNKIRRSSLSPDKKSFCQTTKLPSPRKLSQDKRRGEQNVPNNSGTSANVKTSSVIVGAISASEIFMNTDKDRKSENNQKQFEDSVLQAKHSESYVNENPTSARSQSDIDEVDSKTTGGDEVDLEQERDNFEKSTIQINNLNNEPNGFENELNETMLAGQSNDPQLQENNAHERSLSENGNHVQLDYKNQSLEYDQSLATQNSTGKVLKSENLNSYPDVPEISKSQEQLESTGEKINHQISSAEHGESKKGRKLSMSQDKIHDSRDGGNSNIVGDMKNQGDSLSFVENNSTESELLSQNLREDESNMSGSTESMNDEHKSIQAILSPKTSETSAENKLNSTYHRIISREESSKEHSRISLSEIESAIRIQTIWRGFQARKHLRNLFEEKKLLRNNLRDENENIFGVEDENLTRKGLGISSTEDNETLHGNGRISKNLSNEEEEKQGEERHISNEERRSEDLHEMIEGRRIEVNSNSFNQREAATDKQNSCQDSRGGKGRYSRAKRELDSIDVTTNLGKEYVNQALKIQSAWRAYKVRKNIREVEEKISEIEHLTGIDTKKSIHLSDADILRAVTKIQAGLRGYLARKHVKNIKEQQRSLHGIQEEINTGDMLEMKKVFEDAKIMKVLKQLDEVRIPVTPPEVSPNDKRNGISFNDEQVITTACHEKISNEVSTEINNENNSTHANSFHKVSGSETSRKKHDGRHERECDSDNANGNTRDNHEITEKTQEKNYHESVENNFTGDSENNLRSELVQGGLKKSKAMDNLVKLAEEFEKDNENPDSIEQNDERTKHLSNERESEDISARNLKLNIDDGVNSGSLTEKLASFELPDSDHDSEDNISSNNDVSHGKISSDHVRSKNEINDEENKTGEEKDQTSQGVSENEIDIPSIKQQMNSLYLKKDTISESESKDTVELNTQEMRDLNEETEISENKECRKQKNENEFPKEEIKRGINSVNEEESNKFHCENIANDSVNTENDKFTDNKKNICDRTRSEENDKIKSINIEKTLSLGATPRLDYEIETNMPKHVRSVDQSIDKPVLESSVPLKNTDSASLETNTQPSETIEVTKKISSERPTLTDFMMRTLECRESPSYEYNAMEERRRKNTLADGHKTPIGVEKQICKGSRYEAATKIQSVYRGYRDRKKIESLLLKEKPDSKMSSEFSNEEGQVDTYKSNDRIAYKTESQSPQSPQYDDSSKGVPMDISESNKSEGEEIHTEEIGDTSTEDAGHGRDETQQAVPGQVFVIIEKYIRIKESIQIIQTAEKFKNVFTADLKNDMVNHLRSMETKLLGLTMKDFRSLAYQQADINGIADRFSNKIAG